MNNKDLTEFLCCPKCKMDIDVNDHNYECKNCQISYQTVEGIPLLLSESDVSEHLKGQIEYFEKEDVTKDEEYNLEIWQTNYIDKFVTQFGQQQDKLLIDSGTGSGYIAIELAKRGYKVIATDLTLKSLLRLKKISEKMGISNKIQLVCCVSENLPIKSSIADYLVMNAVLEHIPKEKESIDEINRVCKTGAGLMITVPLNFKYIHPLLVPINKFHDRRIGHLRRYDEEDLTQKFKGWKAEKVFYTGHFKKVVYVILNMFIKMDIAKVEEEDRKIEHEKQDASNICMIFTKSF